ncbi:MAG: hypothetical protein GC189_10555 [Alphaproteobacteria bacterium]|nr:hypothetical protein [Alphaproteobacteria bacterium]
MRQFVIAILAFLTPFIIVLIAQRVRKENAPEIDARVWFAGCVLAALTFAIAAAFDTGSQGGRYVETVDEHGRPVSVFKKDPR